MTTDEFANILTRAALDEANRDSHRLEQIRELQREGLATFEEHKEAYQIRRRQVMRRFR